MIKHHIYAIVTFTGLFAALLAILLITAVSTAYAWRYLTAPPKDINCRLPYTSSNTGAPQNTNLTPIRTNRTI